MKNEEVIVIGAGACGLMVARDLAKSGKKVTILEARNRVGGRIYSFQGGDFTKPIEVGAEFIHGKLPLTQTLLNEAGLHFFEMTGGNYTIREGRIEETLEFIVGFEEVIESMKKLKEDMTMEEFFEKYLDDEKFNITKESVRRFVEGYDAANTDKVSAFALREEWTSGGVDTPFKVIGGYGRLIDYLREKCEKSGCTIVLEAPVKEIRWEKNQVLVATEKGIFNAGKAIVTVPLSVLKINSTSSSFIKFSPSIEEKLKYIDDIGFGGVIKIILEFKSAFWETEEHGDKLKNLGFAISDAIIPVWWTQLPDTRPLLTGWLGGPEADKHKDDSEATLIEYSVDSLSYIFGVASTFIKEEIVASKVMDWGKDPHALGAYAYKTPYSEKAKRILSAPIENTIYFAGEALYKGSEMGTVEAALGSGVEVAKEVIGSDQN